ncbi:hypothetical protein CSOJ01_09407 [Colletotrichum sojae]|uniref:Uncharacterized protein n=1 Tax=Colletotrichum sojae TaxID=2175907 RepID=A0A8H6J3K2_9PEZI|nr:hypothetical protein CSOJ01_09407 [Colletotrichum sojae]
MQLPTIAILTAVFASATSASPVEMLQADHAKVSSFATDLCGGESGTYEVTGSGSYRCIDVTNRRSIKVADKRGCTIKTWSAHGCLGSSWQVPDGDLDCHSVLHGAISLSC